MPATAATPAPAPAAPKGKAVQNLIVGLGEIDGHAHNVTPMGTCVLETVKIDDPKEAHRVSNVFFNVIGGDALVLHEDHFPSLLAEGNWERVIQTQFDPWSNTRRNVLD